MAAEAVSGQDSDGVSLRPGRFLAPVSSSCPPEYAGVPVREVFAEIDAPTGRRRPRRARGSNPGVFSTPVRPVRCSPGWLMP